MSIEIVIPPGEIYDERTNSFSVMNNPVSLIMEHSLVSISKWEAKWHKPFLNTKNKTNEELFDYFRCMTINKNIAPEVYLRLTPANILEISEYIENPMTATTFSNMPKSGTKKIVTSEEIYYDMFAFGIPIECEKWHINRLIALLTICGIRNAPQKKMSKNEIAARNSALNAKRRAALHTKG